MNKKKWSWQISTNPSGKSAVHAACLFCLTVNILNCVVIISSLNLLSSLFFFLNLSVYGISSVFFVLLFCLLIFAFAFILWFLFLGRVAIGLITDWVFNWIGHHLWWGDREEAGLCSELVSIAKVDLEHAAAIVE